MTAIFVSALVGLGLCVWCIRPTTWTAWALAMACSVPLGIGITSATSFLALHGGLSLFVVDAGLCLLAVLAIVFAPKSLPPLTRPTFRPVAAAILVALIVMTAVFAALAAGMPFGDWDAWALWNLRAKYLTAEGEAVRIAYSPQLRDTHPQYPLLLSATVARMWRYAGSTGETAPQRLIVVLFASVTAAGIAAMAARGPMLGWLSAVVLIGVPALPIHASAQYADLPLALFMFLAVVLFAAGQPVLAGLAAGLVAWTKDEGLVFAAAFLVGALVLRRVRTLAGALPILALVLYFKLQLASRSAGTQSPYTTRWDPDRLEPTISALRMSFEGLGSGWYHPVMPVVATLFFFGVDPKRRRDAAFAGWLAISMIAAYIAAYVFSTYDLRWQLSTSVGRLGMQVWPLIGLAGMLGVRSPETLTKPAKQRK